MAGTALDSKRKFPQGDAKGIGILYPDSHFKIKGGEGDLQEPDIFKR
jgi:hypothetical protein